MNFLIVYVVGNILLYLYMENFIGKIWNIVVKFNLYFYDESYFIVKCYSVSDMDEIVCFGLYSFNNRLIIF